MQRGLSSNKEVKEVFLSFHRDHRDIMRMTFLFFLREGIKRWTSYQRVFKHGTGSRVKSILVDLPSPGQWTSYKGALTQCREMKLGADRKKRKRKKEEEEKEEGGRFNWN